MTELFRTLYNSAVLSFHPLARFASVCRSLGLVVLTGCHIYHLSLINHGPLIICSFHIFYPFLVHLEILLQQCYQPIYYTVISFWKGRPGEGRRLWKKTQKSFMKHPAHKVIPYMTMDNGTSCMCIKVHIHLESAHYSVGRAGWSQPPALGHPHHLQKLFLSCKKEGLKRECFIWMFNVMSYTRSLIFFARFSFLL